MTFFPAGAARASAWFRHLRRLFRRDRSDRTTQERIPRLGVEVLEGRVVPSITPGVVQPELPTALHRAAAGTSHHYATYSVGGFKLSAVTLTGSASHETMQGNLTLPLVGAVHLSGSYQDAHHYDLVARTGKISALNGLAQFSSIQLTLSPAGLSVKGHATVGQIGQADFTGSIDTHGHYALHATTSVTVAGFTLKGADLDLGSKALAVDARVPVPDVGNVRFEGSYGPGGRWSLGATIPGPIDLGTFPVYDLHFVLSNTSLTLGARTGINGVLDGGVTGTVYKNGTYRLTVDARGLSSLGGFRVATATATLGNDNAQRLFVMNVHAVLGVPSGPNLTLDGVVDGHGNYDLKGAESVTIDGLTLGQGVFDLNKQTGLTFRASWSDGVWSGNVTGAIGKDGHTWFAGNLAGALGGFSLAGARATVNLDPVQKVYTIDLSGTLNVQVATVTFTGHAALTGGGWGSLALTGTGNIGGALAHILSGSASFTLGPGGAIFVGDLGIPGLSPRFHVEATAHADGTIDIGGVHVSAARLSILDAAHILQGVGANISQVAIGLWNAFPHDLGTLARTLSAIDGNLGHVVIGLSTVVNDVGSVASAIWHNWNSSTRWNIVDLAGALWHDWNGNTSFHLGDLAAALSAVDNSLVGVVSALSSVVNNVGSVASAVWNNWHNSVHWNITDLAVTLWRDWNGNTSFHLGDLAGALSAIDNNLADVVIGLSSVMDDVGQVASAVWNNWRNDVNWNAGDLVGALESVFGLNVVAAWGIVNGL